MNEVYAVRVFRNNRWNIIRFYESQESAEEFANQYILLAWDIKKITVDDAIMAEQS